MLYTQLFPIFQPKTLLSWMATSRGMKSARRDVAAAVFFWACLLAPICMISSVPASASGLPKVEAFTPPDLSVAMTDANGKSLSLSDYVGTPVLVNLWATWCAPCVVELPALDRAAAQLSEDSIKLVLVSVDRGGPAKAIPFLEQRGINTPHLGFDPKGQLARRLNVRGLPSTLLLSADQSKAWLFVGPFEWDTPEVQADIRRLLGK